LALSLLCEFIRRQPPHLHQLLQTPLFENLLKCLQIDTSTRVISLAMTALIMILPHIPSSLASYLPALFNIYSRMLFWDRERSASESMKVEQDDTKSEKSQQVSEDGKSWVKLAYLLESEDETVPELLHYFTFLYGLYPINFMSYIRKPQRYLRHADFPGADDLDIEPSEIRARSEPFRQVHLLHPNFFMLTIESELTDTNRWMKSEAADVVAECMALYNSVDDKPSPTGRSRGPTKKIDPNSDVPEQSLLEEEAQTPYQSRHTSWRNTQSTAVASPNPDPSSGIQRKTSNTSQSLPSIADSPPFTATDRRDADDSPTIPPQILSSQPHLTDMLNSQKSIRGSIYQSLTNDSVNSLPLSNNRHEHIDNYLSSLAREAIPRSPSLRPANIAPSAKVDYLHSEIQLLRNDLNFEQYLKAQHLSHIGQLRRKQIRDARVEAETQNLINSNRQLKSKLEEAKRINSQIKKETEKSKTHSRKWEAELTGKLRLLREEQKKWIAEKNELERDLARATETVDKLRGLVVSSESRELGVRQKVKAVESSLEELARLRTEVEKLAFSLRQYEAGELAALRAIESEKMAQSKVKNLEMQLEARDKEMFQTKQAFESQIEELRLGQEEYLADVAFGRRRKEGYTQDMMDAALSTSRNRVAEIQKAHYHLLDRYHALQAAFVQLKEYHDEHDVDDEPLLSGGSSRPQFMNSDIYGSPSPTARAYNRHIDTIPESGDNERTSPPFRRPPARLDTVSNLNTSYMMTTPAEGRSPISGGHHFQGAPPYSPTGDRGAGGGKGSIDEHSLDAAGKQKIKPQSEVRVYGRGMYFPPSLQFHFTPPTGLSLENCADK
jgi:solute carrier family 25 protein 16